DEVSGSNLFRDLCNDVMEFVSSSSYRSNLLLISTRPYALHRTRLEGLQEMEIKPLNQRQIQDFLRHYYGDTPVVIKLLQDFRQVRQVRELLRVPLLLGIVFSLYQEKREVTTNRLEIYNEIVQRLVKQLDNEKQVTRSAFH